jgi:predicted deacylase
MFRGGGGVPVSTRASSGAGPLTSRISVLAVLLLLVFLGDKMETTVAALSPLGTPATRFHRRTQRIDIPSPAIGQSRYLVIHEYGPEHDVDIMPVSGTGSANGPTCCERAYIQASLHADEIPGMLVNSHLIKVLDQAAKEGRIRKNIVIVPYANPIGLSQQLLGSHQGRFNVDTGVNFNRDWPDVATIVAERIASHLVKGDAEHNVRLVRSEILKAVEEDRGQKEESRMKKALYRLAATSDIVLDLHCDSDAIMHMYTHSRLWPAMSELAAELQSECQITADVSGGNPFDEACSCIWASLADQFPGYPIPMACQSATVELRGECQVT